MATVTATFDCRRVTNQRVLAEGRARPHRWAPEAGYVTSIVHNEKDLETTVDLIRMSHDYFVSKPPVSRGRTGFAIGLVVSSEPESGPPSDLGSRPPR